MLYSCHFGIANNRNCKHDQRVLCGRGKACILRQHALPHQVSLARNEEKLQSVQQKLDEPWNRVVIEKQTAILLFLPLIRNIEVHCSAYNNNLHLVPHLEPAKSTPHDHNLLRSVFYSLPIKAWIPFFKFSDSCIVTLLLPVTRSAHLLLFYLTILITFNEECDGQGM